MFVIIIIFLGNINKTMAKLFFTADWHLFHSKIIEYCNRPIKNIIQMQQHMVYKHNQIVKPEDTVWHLGDVSLLSTEFVGKLRKWVNKFNGTKHLVLGNHDRWKATKYERVGFSTVHTAMWLKYDNMTFYLMHDPAKYTIIQNDPKAVLLCGHIHQLFKHLLPDKRIINVGVDAWNFEPVSYDTILNLLEEHHIYHTIEKDK